MEKIIVTDIDLTVLCFNTPWEQHLRDRGVALPFEGCMLGQCRLTEVLDISNETEMELLEEFFESDHFFNLPALKGAKEALGRLHSAGWQFVAVSACPNREGIPEGRKRNLEHMLGVPFTAVHATGIGGCKRDILSQYPPCVFVEDNYENALVGKELGYRTFLINQKHNQVAGKDLIKRVDSWSEIVDALECLKWSSD